MPFGYKVSAHNLTMDVRNGVELDVAVNELVLMGIPYSDIKIEVIPRQ